MKLTANSPMYTNRPGPKRKGISPKHQFSGANCWFPWLRIIHQNRFFWNKPPPKLHDWNTPGYFLNINVHDSKKVLLHLLLQGVVPLLSLLVLCPQFLHLLCQAMRISRSRCKARPLEMAKKPPTYRPGTYPIPYTRVRNVKKV